MMSPVTPAPNVPPEYVMLVPAPVVMQPVPAAVPTGNHVIVVEETVTPPPPQFASLMDPMAVAEALVTRLKKASIPIAGDRHDAKVSRANRVCMFLILPLPNTLLTMLPTGPNERYH
jgi:hypothetical protein